MNLLYKMYRFSVLASVWLCLAATGSCTKAEPASAVSSSYGDNPCYVSPTAALGSLSQFSADDSTTRTADREIRSMEELRLSDLHAAARYTAENPDAPLAYIVNFEGGGYAVLGADARQGGVIALVEQGTMDAATLISAKAALDQDGDISLPNLVNGLVVAELEDAVSRSEPSYFTSRDLIAGPPIAELQPSMMATQWDQWEPYNYVCSSYSPFVTPVGCSALALAQTLACNKKIHGRTPRAWYYKPHLLLDNINILCNPNWDLITPALSKPTPPSNAIPEIQRLLFAIGRGISMKYGETESRANFDNSVLFLKDSVQYRNVRVSTDLEDIRRMLFINKTPVLVDGVGRDKFDYHNNQVLMGNVHMWIMDGWKREKYSTAVFLPGYVDYTYNRYGFGGLYNGWYKISKSSLAGPYAMRRFIYYTL